VIEKEEWQKPFLWDECECEKCRKKKKKDDK
jgi:hypothetical protein